MPHGRPPVVNREQRDREKDGYYSDRNELIRERERERERDRGYLSDHNSRLLFSRENIIIIIQKINWKFE